MRGAGFALPAGLRLGGGNRRAGIIAWAVLALVTLGPLMLTSERWMRVLILVLVYVVLASGLNLLVGHTGLLDLGYVAFFAVGAYFTSIVTVKVAIDGLGLAPESVWWLFFVNLILAGAFTACVGVVLGYPTLRARGDYLAIMTLAFGEVVRLLAINWDGLTGGPIGIRGVPPIEIFGFELVEPLYLYYAALAIAAVSIFLISRLVASYVGRAWNAIREDELAAECMGVATHRYKLLAYAGGAVFAGVIGVFFAHLQQYINPDSFLLEDNLLILALVILGGAGTIWGPALGAAIWIIFQDWAGDLGVVQEYPELRMVALALLILIVIRYLPRGIIHSPPRLSFAPMRGGNAQPPDPGPSSGRGSPPAAVDGETPVVEARGLVCRFGGVLALDGVDLRVDEGEIVGVIGPNGAGKTTLFNALSGVVATERGTIAIGGREIDGLTPSGVAARGVSRTFQTVRLAGDMTVLENLLVAAHRTARTSPFAVALRTPSAREGERLATADVERAMRIVGIDAGLRDARAGGLSHYDQRLVEIARALVARPRVVLLDEPAAGLNPTETREIGSVIERIRDGGVAVVLIEHDMSLLMEISDRVVVLDHGERIAEGTPDGVRADERVLTAYLGAAG